MIREALINMGKKYLIGDKPGCLVPAEDMDARTPAQRRKSGRHGSNRFATKHTSTQPGFPGDKAARGNKPRPASNTTSGNARSEGGQKKHGAQKPAGGQNRGRSAGNGPNRQRAAQR
jgi:hypothetical protein